MKAVEHKQVAQQYAERQRFLVEKVISDFILFFKNSIFKFSFSHFRQLKKPKLKSF